ncbi:MAG: HEAT repeat domain-containing protein, partial [Planctomycetes bacterium]|nr:HEAT repeat domain-containing protein [Planctomycetota bacterium]
MQIVSWISDPAFTTRLTLALLHFLWQGACGGLVVAVGGIVCRGTSARSRYLLNVAVLLAMAACLPVTFWLVEVPAGPVPSAAPTLEATLPPAPEATFPPEVVPQVSPAPPVVPEFPPTEQAVHTPLGTPDTTPAADENPTSVSVAEQPWSPLTWQSVSQWVALLYLTGVAVVLGRLVRGIWGGRRLRQLATVVADPALLEIVHRLARRLELKVAPVIAWCGEISIPVVVGVLRPMILLPSAVVSGLTPDQLQALLLHELAHIRRFDPIVNLLQRVIEALLFFHPVVWFVSRRVRVMREHAADDMVLAAGWNRPRYADALLRAAELASAFAYPDPARQATVLGAAGTSQSEFKVRVLRLIEESQAPKLQVSPSGVLACLLLFAAIGIVACLQATSSETTSDHSDTPQAAVPVDDAVPGSQAEEPTRLQILNADGSPARDVQVVLAHQGFPKPPSDHWVGEPNREGVVSLAGLPTGRPVLLAAGLAERQTVFPLQLPADKPLLEQRLQAGRPGFDKQVELGRQPTMHVDAEEGEVLDVEIQNGTKAPLTVSEADLHLRVMVGDELFRCFPVSLLTPDRQPAAPIEIAAGQTGRLSLNWKQWARHGVWVSRRHEVIAEPAWLPPEPGKVFACVGLGRTSTLGVIVTDPAVIVAQDEQAAAAAEENRLARFQNLQDADVAAFVLRTVRTPFIDDPARGTWQLGAHDAQVMSELSMVRQQEDVVKTLLQVVDRSEPASIDERRLALTYLAGAAPQQVIPRLIKELESALQTPTERFPAYSEIEVLGRIGEEARDAIPVLIKLLDSTDGPACSEALLALVKIGPSSVELLNAIAARLGDPQESVWSRAVYELGRYGTLAKPWGPTFVKLLDAKTSEARTWAAQALVKSGYDAQQGFRVLGTDLAKGTVEDRCRAATALASLGSQAQSMLPRLREFENDADVRVVSAVQDAIRRIEKDDRILTHAEEAAKNAAGRKTGAEAVARLRAALTKPIKAVLPDGGILELHNLTQSSLSPNSLHQRVWWQGDGTLDEEANARELPPEFVTHARFDARVVHFVARTKTPQASLCLRTVPPRQMRGPVYIDHQDSRGRPARGFSAEFGPVESEKSTSIKVGLTDEPWGDWQQISPEGQLLNTIDPSRPHWSSYQQIKLLYAGPQVDFVIPPEGTPADPNHYVDSAIVLELPRHYEDLWAFEIRAVIAAGQTTSVFEWSDQDKVPFQKTFRLNGDVFREQFARFEYRLRPYRYWVTFDQVSLEPGHLTDVKVSVATVAEAPPRAVSAQGEILSLDPDKKTVVISLGTDDGLQPRTTLAVQQRPVGQVAKPPIVKGKLEVTRVLSSATAEARILEDDAKNPLAKSDLVVVLAAAGANPAETSATRPLLLPDHWMVRAVGFDRDSQELVTVSSQSAVTIRRWDLKGQKLLSELKLTADKHGRAIRDETLRLSADCQRVLGATDAYVGIWDAATGNLLKQLPIPKVENNDTVRHLTCTPDFSVIVGSLETEYARLTLVYDAHTVVWDGNTGKLLRTLTHKNQNHFFDMSLSPDGKRLATTNGGARIWDTTTGKELRELPNDNTGRKHSDPEVTAQATNNVWSVRFSPNGELIATGDILGVKLFNAASGQRIRVLDSPYRYSSGFGGPNLVFSPDGQRLARLGTGDKQGKTGTRYVVPIWSTQTGKTLYELPTDASCGAFSEDGQRLAVGFSDLQQALLVWPLVAGAGTAAEPIGPGPEPREDKVEQNGHYRGAKAAEFIEKFKPTWGETKLGIQYGIALTKPQRQYAVGERVPLVVFFRNVSDKPLKIDMSPDYYGNPPRVVNGQGTVIELENVLLAGTIARYVEQLAPGEAVGPFYLNFGLGENPRPGKQSWHPYFKTPVAGPYTLTHRVSIDVQGLNKGDQPQKTPLTTGEIGFDIVAPGQAAVREPQPLDPVKELASFQGTWSWDFSQPWTWPQPIGVGTDSDDRRSEKRWVIDGDLITWVGRDGQRVYVRFTLDPSVSPPEIDFTFLNGPFRGQKSIGIYQSKDDAAYRELCMTDPGTDAPRPTEFTGGSTLQQSLIFIHRVAPPAKPALAKVLKRLQGVWNMELCDSTLPTYGGTQQEASQWQWTIKDDEILWSRQGDVWKLKLNLERAQSPRALDPTFHSAPYEMDLTFLDGPYQGAKCAGLLGWGGVDGQSLMLAIQDPGSDAPRPTKFHMNSAVKTGLMILRPSRPSDAERELAAFQGAWTLRNFDTGSVERNKDPSSWPLPGGQGPDKLGAGSELRWTIAGKQISWTDFAGETITASFKINSFQLPHQIDLTFLSGPHQGETCPGIYQRDDLDANILWLCLANPGSNAARPKEFSYQWGAGRSLLSLYAIDPSTERVAAAPPPAEKSKSVGVNSPEPSGGQGVVPGTVAGPEPARRSTAAQDAAVSVSLEQLLESFSTAKYDWQQSEVAQKIIELGDPAAIARMLPYVDSAKRRTRCNAGLVLARLGDPRGRDVLIKELQDTQPRPIEPGEARGKTDLGVQITSDRYYAALLLGKLGDRAAVPALIAATRDATINYRAAISLGQIGDRQAIPAVRQMLLDFPKERLWVGYSLAMLGESDGFDILVETTADALWTQRRHAVEALGTLSDRKAVPTLVKALHDEHANVKVSAAQSLAQIGDVAALPALTEALKDETTTESGPLTSVAKAAREAIDTIEAKHRASPKPEEKSASSYLNTPRGQMPPLGKALELDVFALKLRSVTPQDWIVVRNDRAFRLQGPEVPAGQERARIHLWFDDRSINSSDIEKRDKALPKISQLNGTRLGCLYFDRNSAAVNLWPEFGFAIRLIDPVDQIAIGSADVLESDVISQAWSNAAFVRYVDIQPDGRRRNYLMKTDSSPLGITPTTKFLVVGELPDPARAATDAAKEIAQRHRDTFNELKAEADTSGVKTISLADFELYTKSLLKEGRGSGVRRITDANQLQVPECLVTGRGLVEVKRIAAMQKVEVPATGRQIGRTDDTAPGEAPDLLLSDVIRDFNLQNQRLGQGLDQPALTETEVLEFLNRAERKRDARDLNDQEFASLPAVAASKRVPKGSYLQVDTEQPHDVFSVDHLWRIRLMLPAIGHDGFVGVTIRNTKISEEKIDPRHVAWGPADKSGLSLGAYLSPRKEKYELGERLRLRLFVRNDSQQDVDTSWANTSHPMPDDFRVIDQTGAKVAVRKGQAENWSLPWISGSIRGSLAPGETHCLSVPFEISIGGDGANKLVGRVIEARAGQMLQLRVRQPNGSNLERAKNEPEPESGTIALKIIGDEKIDSKSIGKFRGRVTGPDGQPLSHARIFVAPRTKNLKTVGKVRAETDGDGRF